MLPLLWRIFAANLFAQFVVGFITLFTTILGLFGKDMYRTEQSSGLLVLESVKSDDVI
jgi:hypothetical protein